MGGEIKKEYDLGKSGRIVCHVSEDGKRLLIEFDVDKEGLNKTGVNGLIEALKKAGLHFRNQMEVGPGGRQIQLEDPDGNPIELFEPAGSR